MFGVSHRQNEIFFMWMFDISGWIYRLTSQRCASGFLSTDITKWPECKRLWCRCTTTTNPVSPVLRLKRQLFRCRDHISPIALSHSQKSSTGVQLRPPRQEQLLLLLWFGLRSLPLRNVCRHFLLSLCLQRHLLCLLHDARSRSFFHCSLTRLK